MHHQLVIDITSPPWVGQGTHWNIMRKSTLPQIILGPGYYVLCELIRSGKLSIAAALLRDIWCSGLQICAFYTMQRF